MRKRKSLHMPARAVERQSKSSSSCSVSFSSSISCSVCKKFWSKFRLLSLERDEVVITDGLNFAAGCSLQRHLVFPVRNQPCGDSEKHGPPVARSFYRKATRAPGEIAPGGSNLSNEALIIFFSLNIELELD